MERRFSIGAKCRRNTHCERNSATDPDNKGNYGSKGYIPPGIYFLHHHRLQTGSDGTNRDRLGLSDDKCGETIKVARNGNVITRAFLQFHIAYNDLEACKKDVSEGCITLTRENFQTLFTPLLTLSNPSLNACGHGSSQYAGAGNILVFVTDTATTGAQAKQVALFQNVAKGDAVDGLSLDDFGANKTILTLLRSKWSKQ